MGPEDRVSSVLAGKQSSTLPYHRPGGNYVSYSGRTYPAQVNRFERGTDLLRRQMPMLNDIFEVVVVCTYFLSPLQLRVIP